MGTAATRLSALLAVAHGVALAFVGALFAQLGAELAVGLRTLAGASHGRSSGLADLGAVNIQRDAARHHLDVLLPQALRCAVIAGLGACVAGLDAVGKLLVGH